MHPQTPTILGMPAPAKHSASLGASHDSGQILVDKGRHWPGLVLSL